MLHLVINSCNIVIAWNSEFALIVCSSFLIDHVWQSQQNWCLAFTLFLVIHDSHIQTLSSVFKILSNFIQHFIIRRALYKGWWWPGLKFQTPALKFQNRRWSLQPVVKAADIWHKRPTIPINMYNMRGRCVKHWSRTPADPGSIPGAGDKNKRLISLPCNIRGCAPRDSHIT